MSLSMNLEAELLTYFESITLFCIYFIWAFYILDFYALLLHSIIHLFFYAWKRWADSRTNKNIKAPPKVSSITPKYPCQEEEEEEEEEDRHADNDKLTLLEGEVKMVMGRLGLSCHLNGGKIYEQVGSNEMETLFDEIEPSLEEVKQAFDVFDANKDGFIDSMELKKVLCALGFVHSTEGVCQSMISSYDDDGDGLVNFSEFVKLFEKSFY